MLRRGREPRSCSFSSLLRHGGSTGALRNGGRESQSVTMTSGDPLPIPPFGLGVLGFNRLRAHVALASHT